MQKNPTIKNAIDGRGNRGQACRHRRAGTFRPCLVKVSVNSPNHTKKNICKKRYAFEFFRHTVCVERNERTDDSVNISSPSPVLDEQSRRGLRCCVYGVSDSPYTSSNLRTDGQPLKSGNDSGKADKLSVVGRGLPSNDDLSSAGNTGLFRPGGNHISQCIGYKLWRQVPDAQANLHGSAKNGQNVDKKAKKSGQCPLNT